MAQAPISLVTGDGLNLSATVWTHPSPRAAAVLVHGMSGSKDQPALGAVAEALNGAGLAVLAYDSRGHGASEGLCTLGALERLDVAAAVSVARECAEQVVVIGASMGGIAALRYAAEDPELAGVVTVSTPAVWQVPRTARGALSVIVTRTGAGRRIAGSYLGVRLSKTWVSMDPPVSLAGRLRAPYAVVHGLKDRFVTYRQGRLLYRAATGRRRLTLVPGMGHAFDPLAVPAIRAALEWSLGERQAAAGLLV